MPLLAGVRESLERGALTGGAARNAAYLEALVDYGRASEADRALLVDPQTSGGLLVALPPARAAVFVQEIVGAVVVGEVLAQGDRAIVVV